MSKRGAEKQLTDRNWDRDEDDDDDNGGSESTEGFAQAAPAQLATRKIRGLPQRKTASASPSPAPEAPPKASPFSAFSGFGTTPTSAAPKPNPFASLATASSTATPPPPASAFPSSLLPSGGMSAFTFPSSSSTLSNGSTSGAGSPQPFSFGPITGSSPSPSPPPTFIPTFPAPPSTTTTSTTSSSSQKPALKYYTNLRALNLSFLDAVQGQVNQDPFGDLFPGEGKLKKKYDEERRKIEAEYKDSDKKKKGGGEENGGRMDVDKPALPTPTFSFTPSPNPPPPKVTAPALPTPTISFTPPAAVTPSTTIPEIKTTPPEPTPPAVPAPPAFSLPKAPGTFSWGGTVVKETKADAPKAPTTGGFVLKKEEPKKGEEKSAFKFPVPPPAPVAAASPPSPSSTSIPVPALAPALPPKIANAPTTPSPLRFGASTSSNSTSDLPSASSATSPPTTVTTSTGPKEKFSFGGTFDSIINDKKDKPVLAAPSFSGFSFAKTGAGAEKTEAEASNPSPRTATFNTSPTNNSTEAPKAAPAAFKFGSTATAAIAASPVPTKSPFSFGPAVHPPPTAPKPIAAPASPPITTTFGFGSSGSPPSFGFGAALPKKETSVTGGKSAGFSFGAGGSGSPFSFATPATTANGDAKKITTGFSFGPAVTPSTGVGFGFGAPPQSSHTASAAPAATLTEIDDAEGETSKEGSVDSSGVVTPEEGASLRSTGAGEEDEVIDFESRGKVWRGVIGSADMADLGIGRILIKDNSGKKRLLVRNEVTSGVLINMRLTPTLSFKLEKTFITFLGFEGTEPKMFRLRVKTKEMAEELKAKLEEAGSAA